MKAERKGRVINVELSAGRRRTSEPLPGLVLVDCDGCDVLVMFERITPGWRQKLIAETAKDGG